MFWEIGYSARRILLVLCISNFQSGDSQENYDYEINLVIIY